MLYLYDRVAMERALTLPLDRRLHELLAQRIASLVTPDGDLSDWTEYLIVEKSDREADIVREIGLSPLFEPIDGIRYGEPCFRPHWDWLACHDGFFEMILTFGGTFAYVLFIEDHPDADPELLAMAREFAK